MIFRIAWRNIWRNRLRSGVVITAISLGLWAGVFVSAFVRGITNQKVESIIRLEMAHFQAHNPNFREEMLPKYTVEGGEELMQQLRDTPKVTGVSGRAIALGMINSTDKSGSIKVIGIAPEEELKVSDLHKTLVEGDYFEGKSRNGILVSSQTAKEYDLKLRSKVVVTLQDVRGEMTAGAFRVVGIFDSKNPMYDKMNAFVRLENLQGLLGIGTQVHEVAVMLDKHELAEATAQHWQEQYPDLEIKAWLDLAPGMRFVVEAQGTYTLAIVGIILFALLFSIINTMLMAVLERVREIGMLMAVGMSKWRVFKMIMLETVCLAMIGGILGLLLSYASIQYFGSQGINLSGAAYGDFGFAEIVYPELDLMSYIEVSLMVFGMAVIGSLFPARKALKLIPVEAIRKV